jgi:hypothetical protein
VANFNEQNWGDLHERVHRRTLRAVTGSSNSAKGSADPSNWMPPDHAAWCGYLADWVAIKARWRLSLDQSEFGRIRNLLTDSCPGQLIDPWPVAPPTTPTTTPASAPPPVQRVLPEQPVGDCDPAYQRSSDPGHIRKAEPSPGAGSASFKAIGEQSGDVATGRWTARADLVVIAVGRRCQRDATRSPVTDAGRVNHRRLGVSRSLIRVRTDEHARRFPHDAVGRHIASPGQQPVNTRSQGEPP